jgi:Mlc titration factor MtfA (ptsG expression regulator)
VLRRWWSAYQKQRDESTLRKRPIPEALWQLTLARYPFLSRRSEADRSELRRLSTLFLAAKEFAGAQGLEVSDEIAVAVAAQACLPVLRLGLQHYNGFVGIVIHPDEVVAKREVMDEDGIVHRYDETLSGEAMEGGPIMLSWRDVESAGESAQWAYNVVIHEFAHVLDMTDGVANGVPLLSGRAAREAWEQSIVAEFEAFCGQVDGGHDTLLDPYGSQSVDEFFAVASEAFFVAPHDMQREHPNLYALLASYYRQDPGGDLAGEPPTA